MKIIDLLPREAVYCGIAARSRKHVLDLISEVLAKRSEGVFGATEVFDTLVSRERLGCTALGDGVAMPHGRLTGLQAPLGVFLRLTAPVDFDTGEHRPVDLVFGLLIPEAAPRDCSEILAALATRFRRAEFRRRIRDAADADAVHALLIAEAVSDMPADA